MRIVALVGSPRGSRGNTARLLRHVLDGARARGAEAETVYLSEDAVLPCRGCDACHRLGSCPQDDRFEWIRGKIMQADGLVLASPNYVFHVSAQLKAFMDRCCGVIHCMAFRGTYGAVVETSGGGGDEAVAEAMTRFLMATGAVPVGAVWAAMGAIQGEEFPDDVRRAAEDLGQRLVDAWASRSVPPEAAAWMRAFEERMRGLVAFRREEWPYEHRYWQALERGTQD